MTSTDSIGKGQMPAQTGRRGLRVLAETGDDPAPTLVHDVGAADQPDDEYQGYEQPGTPHGKLASRRRDLVARLGRLLASEQLVEPADEVAPDLVEIGRAGAAAFTPLRIVQGHDLRVPRGALGSVT